MNLWGGIQALGVGKTCGDVCQHVQYDTSNCWEKINCVVFLTSKDDCNQVLVLKLGLVLKL